MYSADSPQTAEFSWKAAAVIALAAFLLFGYGLSDRFFEDEYAYISQTYYWNLFIEGRWNDKAWTDAPAYDLPPLPKYLIGLSMSAAGLPMPRPVDAYAWYDHYQRFGVPATLTVARLPIVPVGVAGCLALYGIGVVLGDRRAGMIAAVFLMINPLYQLHAHRAMSDIPCETFLMFGLLAGLLAWRNAWARGPTARVAWLFLLAGVGLGLGLLCKFNALLGLMIIAGWTLFGLFNPSLPVRHKLTQSFGAVATALTTFLLFVALNPFMTSQGAPVVLAPGVEPPGNDPWSRFRFQIDHRMRLSRGQQQSFPHNALETGLDKAKVFFVQGFGRFGPLGPTKSDSKIRYQARQDWGFLLWAPIVVVGLIATARRSRIEWRAAMPPMAATLLIWCTVSWAVVGYYLPMAWDRYLLPIQSVNSLLAGFGVVAIWDWLRRPARAS